MSVNPILSNNINIFMLQSSKKNSSNEQKIDEKSNNNNGKISTIILKDTIVTIFLGFVKI